MNTPGLKSRPEFSFGTALKRTAESQKLPRKQLMARFEEWACGLI